MRHLNNLGQTLADVLARLVSFLGAVFATLLVGIVMAAPYFASVIGNIGRRPVIYRRAPVRRRLSAPRRSPA